MEQTKNEPGEPLLEKEDVVFDGQGEPVLEKEDSRIFTSIDKAIEHFGEDVERRSICVIVDRQDDIPGLSWTIREKIQKYPSLGRLSVNRMYIRTGSKMGRTLFSFKLKNMNCIGERWTGVLLFSNKPEEIQESQWFKENVLPLVGSRD